MYAHITVNGRAVEADVDGKGGRGPCWVLGSTIEAYLSISDGKHIERIEVSHVL